MRLWVGLKITFEFKLSLVSLKPAAVIEMQFASLDK